MSKELNNYNRIMAAIEWLNMTPNSFAMHIGMTRAENLYHILKCDYGVTPDMADRIVKNCPEINRTWLLTGIGDALVPKVDSGRSIPLYEGSVETILPTIAQHKPIGYVDEPGIRDCDIVVCSSSEAMIAPEIDCVMLGLKYVDHDKIKTNCEYVLQLHNKVIWRKVKSIDGYDIVLSPLNEVGFKDIHIDATDVVKAWEVSVKTRMPI